ncbi:2310034G01Rik [Phodopus roborovskii]|uniref:2310034G01Rik protein n=2 Tax=Phodopus roborovskii TaxID=109678 RepID=A0AAU9ZYT6_PHORO|nr:2310034G01Rik [Phodopus roborovskii]
MYSYVCLPPGEGVWPRLQTLTYTYLPAPLLLPPIHTHNFCSRPAAEFRCFHGAGAALGSTPPWWPFLPPGAATLGSSSSAAAAAGAHAPSQPAPDAERRAPWPEGGSLQLQLRWGRVERTRGPALPLPDAVRRDLRRVYGTYPRTDVRVTQRGGQFLVRAAPRVGEPEYRVARRVMHRPAGRDDADSGDSRAAPEPGQRGRPRKKQGLR